MPSRRCVQVLLTLIKEHSLEASSSECSSETDFYKGGVYSVARHSWKSQCTIAAQYWIHLCLEPHRSGRGVQLAECSMASPKIMIKKTNLKPLCFIGRKASRDVSI